MYAKPQPGNKMAVLLVNMDPGEQQAQVDLAALGFEGGSVHVRDVWAKKAAPDSGPPNGQLAAKLPPYDSALLLLSPADPKDQSGPHPYQKISAEWATKINATQYTAFSRVGCSYKNWADAVR